MSVDQPYPIHETLDKLIQNFKEFRNKTFPRGIPQPVSDWKNHLQAITQFEAQMIRLVSDYMGGQKVDLQKIPAAKLLKENLRSFLSTKNETNNYRDQLIDYTDQIETLGFLLQDCCETLGNPCSQYKHLE